MWPTLIFETADPDKNHAHNDCLGNGHWLIRHEPFCPAAACTRTTPIRRGDICACTFRGRHLKHFVSEILAPTTITLAAPCDSECSMRFDLRSCRDFVVALWTAAVLILAQPDLPRVGPVNNIPSGFTPDTILYMVLHSIRYIDIRLIYTGI